MVAPEYQSEQSPFFTDAIAAFGPEGAQHLGFTIVHAFTEAQSRLPLLQPIRGFQLMVAETGSWVDEFADSENGIVKLNFSPSSAKDIGALCLETERLVEHGVAHVAHEQQYPRFYEDSRPEHFLFAAAIREGVAQYAEMSLFEPVDTSSYVLECPDEVAESVMEVISTLLYEPPNNQVDLHYDFLFGNMDFPVDGYEVGRFIVSAMVNDHGLSLTELMKLPVREYKAFAESEL